ncbi:MAG TPA: ATP-binding protein, partial [Burkholderiales bacterium]|nr:ATP-binding protein [Burkholderiales bacterium]
HVVDRLDDMRIPPLPRNHTQRTLVSLLLACVLIAGAFGLRLALNASLGADYVFGVFYVATASAAWLGGAQAGLIAMGLAAAASFHILSRLHVPTAGDWLEIAIFLGGSILMCLVIEARQRAALAARENHAAFQALIEAVPMGVALFDRDMRYLMVNERLAGMNGIPAREHIGKTVRQVLPHIVPQVGAAFERALGAEGRYYAEFKAVTPGTAGEERVWRECWFPVRLGNSPVYVGATIEDVTDERSAQDVLAHAARRREETLGLIAHELRGPLGTLGIALAVLARSSGPAREEPSVALAQRQVGFIARLLEDLLDAARLDTGKAVLKRSVVDLRGVVREAAETCKVDTTPRRQRVQLVMPSEAVMQSIDPSRIKQVVCNLISNASKFSPHGADILVSVRPGGGETRISVRDWGEGLPPSEIGRVFDKWEQGARGDRSGLGIGLALVKGLTELHGGRVTVSSEGVGLGCEFVVILPSQWKAEV